MKSPSLGGAWGRAVPPSCAVRVMLDRFCSPALHCPAQGSLHSSPSSGLNFCRWERAVTPGIPAQESSPGLGWTLHSRGMREEWGTQHTRSLSHWRYSVIMSVICIYHRGLCGYKDTIKQSSPLIPSHFSKLTPLKADCSETEVQLKEQAEVTLSP